MVSGFLPKILTQQIDHHQVRKFDEKFWDRTITCAEYPNGVYINIFGLLEEKALTKSNEKGTKDQDLKVDENKSNDNSTKFLFMQSQRSQYQLSKIQKEKEKTWLLQNLDTAVLFGLETNDELAQDEKETETRYKQTKSLIKPKKKIVKLSNKKKSILQKKKRKQPNQKIIADDVEEDNVEEDEKCGDFVKANFHKGKRPRIEQFIDSNIDENTIDETDVTDATDLDEDEDEDDDDEEEEDDDNDKIEEEEQDEFDVRDKINAHEEEESLIENENIEEIASDADEHENESVDQFSDDDDDDSISQSSEYDNGEVEEEEEAEEN